METLHIVVAGLGNTGSHLLPHLARIPAVTRITLVDPDRYEESENNLAGQNIDRSDLGGSKAEVQAEKLRRIRPDIEVVPIQARIEDVPRGLLLSDLFAGCLDSKLARQHLNEISWRLAIPWIDLGGARQPEPCPRDDLSARGRCAVSRCGWDPGPHGEYSLIEQEYLCGTGAHRFASMASSPWAGWPTASMAAIEIAKFRRCAAGQLWRPASDRRCRALQDASFRRTPQPMVPL